MTIVNSSLGKVGYYIEDMTNTASFGVSVSGSSPYTQTHFISVDFPQPPIERLDVNVLEQRVDAGRFAVNGFRRPTVNLTRYLEGAPTPLSKSVAPQTCHAANLLSVAFGGIVANSGGLVVTGGATAVTLESGQGANFKAGQFVGFLDSNGDLKTTQINQVNGDQLIFARNLGFTVPSGSKAFNSHTVYLTQNPSSSLQLHIQGAEDNDVWVATGLNGNVSIETELGQLATFGMALNGAHWHSGSASELTEEDYGSVTPPAVIDSEILFFQSGSTPTAFVANETGVTLNINYAAVEAPHGVNGLVRWVRQRAFPVATGMLGAYFEDWSYFQGWEGNKEWIYQYQIGSAPGGTVVICMPRVEITSVERGDRNGLQGQTINFRAHEDDKKTADTGYADLAKSAICIGFL